MKNQESSANIKVLFDMKAITANNINMKDIKKMKNIINTSTQSRDIYEVQSKYNRVLKTLTLHILKYLLKDILCEETDFSLIKSNKTIPDYGLCEKCNIFILIEDPPKFLILNIYDNMIYQTYVRGINKREILYYLCDKNDDNNSLHIG